MFHLFLSLRLFAVIFMVFAYEAKWVFMSCCTFTDGKAITIDNIDNTQYALKDLVPGATYQVQAFTVFENKESAAYTSRNFTTSK